MHGWARVGYDVKHVLIVDLILLKKNFVWSTKKSFEKSFEFKNSNLSIMITKSKEKTCKDTWNLDKNKIKVIISSDEISE